MSLNYNLNKKGGHHVSIVNYIGIIMSRTVRIKNNYTAHLCKPWKPRSIPKDCDYDYVFVSGSEIGKDDDYEYLVKVPADSKEEKWHYKKFMHGDGYAGANRYSWRDDKWVRVMCNKEERREVRQVLNYFTCGVFDDVVLETYKHCIPCHYW